MPCPAFATDLTVSHLSGRIIRLLFTDESIKDMADMHRQRYVPILRHLPSQQSGRSCIRGLPRTDAMHFRRWALEELSSDREM